MKVVFIFFSVLLSSFVFANNMQLQKVSLTDTNRTAKTVNIKMNISWEHSWRDSINWDAAWIIIKYKEPKDSAWKWKHAQLVQTGNNTGTATGVKIVVPDDLTGAFFYRSAIGSGNIASDNVKLVWNYGTAGVTNIDSVEVRVFSTEMVYVPQGSYCLGDGNGTTRSENAFQLKNAPNNYVVINDKWTPLINTLGNNGFSIINDDAIVYNTGIRISGLNGLDVNNDKVADFPNFPTGYKSYYTMKYKVTQGQYTDFLNTVCTNDTNVAVLNSFLSAGNPSNSEFYKIQSLPKQLKVFWMKLGDSYSVTNTGQGRYSIFFDSTQLRFTVSRPDRVYNIMDVDKGLSFSEWVGLRPMSELEFEKTSRGPLPPLYNEKAWGDDSQIPLHPGFPFGTNLILSGNENGTEYFTNFDVTKRNFIPYNYNYSNTYTVTGGDGGTGPYRVGIYANDTSSRVSSGAGYYGVMDVSKITGEFVFPLSTSTNRTFSYFTNGKGSLSAFGNNYSFASSYGSIVVAGFYRNYTISRRGNINNSGAAPFLNDYSFRAVRSAPLDN